MNLDLEFDITSAAAEVFQLALEEASGLSELSPLIDQAIRDVRRAHPDLPRSAIPFALGRAIGRLEASRFKGKAVP